MSTYFAWFVTSFVTTVLTLSMLYNIWLLLFSPSGGFDNIVWAFLCGIGAMVFMVVAPKD